MISNGSNISNTLNSISMITLIVDLAGCLHFCLKDKIQQCATLVLGPQTDRGYNSQPIVGE